MAARGSELCVAILLAGVLVASRVAASPKQFGGEATAYSNAVNGSGASFMCGFPYLNKWASINFAAINKPQYAGGAQCGRCVLVRCVDPRCKVKNKDIKVYLVDQCPECKSGDLDFSIPAFKRITGMPPDRLKISWRFISCAPQISGPIRMHWKDGGSIYWQAWFFSNFNQPIKSATVDGQPLKRTLYGFWTHDAKLDLGQAHTVKLVGTGGKVLTAKVANVTAATSILGVQF